MANCSCMRGYTVYQKYMKWATEGEGCTKGMQTQSVLFPKKKWSQAQARTWLRAHKMTVGKVDETANYYRYRQLAPGTCEKKSFRVIPFGGKIKAVVCCPR